MDIQDRVTLLLVAVGAVTIFLIAMKERRWYIFTIIGLVFVIIFLLSEMHHDRREYPTANFSCESSQLPPPTTRKIKRDYKIGYCTRYK